MADAVLNQATPVSGTKYTVLDTTRNCRIHSIVAKVTWTVQPTPLEIHLTIDGEAFVATQANPVTATDYALAQSVATDMLAAVAGVFTTAYNVDALPIYNYEGQSVKVEVETTGGTVDPLECRVKYSVLQ
jgi:hypothetical protein